jgi:hypothetical protein
MMVDTKKKIGKDKSVQEAQYMRIEKNGRFLVI